MPTYTYRNLDTGETFEIKQSMRDEPLTQHPETGAPVKRLLSKPAIAFKGSGFYVTDSRSGGGQGGKTAGSDKSAQGGKGPEKSSTPTSKPEGGSSGPKGGSGI